MNINFLVPNLKNSQLGLYLLQECNKARGVSPIIFVEGASTFTARPQVPVMNVAEAWHQEGPFVATTPSLTQKMLTFPRATKRIFYVWDLYWIRGNKRMYEPYLYLFSQPELHIVARSESHRDLIEQSFNVEVDAIVENFGLAGFIKML